LKLRSFELDDYVIIPELGKTVHVVGKSVNEIDRKLALACMSKPLFFLPSKISTY